MLRNEVSWDRVLRVPIGFRVGAERPSRSGAS